jgi:hypothetical protein
MDPVIRVSQTRLRRVLVFRPGERAFDMLGRDLAFARPDRFALRTVLDAFRR